MAKRKYIQFHCILHHISIPEFYRGNYKKKNALIIYLLKKKKKIMTFKYNILLQAKNISFLNFLSLTCTISYHVEHDFMTWSKEKKSFYLIKLTKWKKCKES